MLRHGFHPPEAQPRGSIQIARSVHPEGRTPESGKFSTLFDNLCYNEYDPNPRPGTERRAPDLLRAARALTHHNLLDWAAYDRLGCTFGVGWRNQRTRFPRLHRTVPGADPAAGRRCRARQSQLEQGPRRAGGDRGRKRDAALPAVLQPRPEPRSSWCSRSSNATCETPKSGPSMSSCKPSVGCSTASVLTSAPITSGTADLYSQNDNGLRKPRRKFAFAAANRTIGTAPCPPHKTAYSVIIRSLWK